MSMHLLDMMTLRVIMKIDWLTSFRTVINRHARHMSFVTSVGTITLQGVCKTETLGVLLAIT